MIADTCRFGRPRITKLRIPEGGNALAKVLLGRLNPSSKLAMTWLKKLEDSPAHALATTGFDALQQDYIEGSFVSYCYFETYKVEPVFAFGHGLSQSRKVLRPWREAPPELFVYRKP